LPCQSKPAKRAHIISCRLTSGWRSNHLTANGTGAQQEMRYTGSNENKRHIPIVLATVDPKCRCLLACAELLHMHCTCTILC
jgi:hypothetical protein